MGHFYKKLILSGIFAVATAGLFNTAGASALGFLDSEFTNPFGLESASLLESAQPSSTDDSIPTLLYNRISDGETLWGYDGQGIVFADADGLVNGNPRLKTAKRGDTLTFSVKIEPERYYDDAETEPFSTYVIAASLSQGLTLDYDSIVLKINDQVISDEDVSVEQVNGELGLSYYLRKTITFSQTSQGTTTFNYPEGAAIELTYSATIDSDAPSQLFSRASYNAYTNNYSKSISSGDAIYGGNGYQLDVLLDGRIIIRRVDANNQPLAGAKYTIDGVKANADRTSGTYTYDSNGSVSEFITDKDGMIVINGVPFGTYAAKEVSSPTGHEVLVSTISKNLEQEIQEVETGKLSYRMNLYGIDIASSIIDSNQGKMVPDPELSAFMGDSSGEIIATMDESQGGYSFNGGVVKKTANGYQLLMNNAEPVDFVYDSTLNKYLARISNADTQNAYQISINGDEATLAGRQSFTLLLNQETGCYEGVLQEQNAAITMCSDGESGYYFIEDMDMSSGTYSIGIHLTYDEGVDGYVESSSAIFSIEEESDSELRLLGNYLIVVIPQIGAHYMFLDNGTLWPLNTAPQSVLGTEFLFQEKTSGSETMPEDIANPQTGDAIIKAIFIATIGLAPIFLFRKQLSKR